jgi:hypothetical protein
MGTTEKVRLHLLQIAQTNRGLGIKPNLQPHLFRKPLLYLSELRGHRTKIGSISHLNSDQHFSFRTNFHTNSYRTKGKSRGTALQFLGPIFIKFTSWTASLGDINGEVQGLRKWLRLRLFYVRETSGLLTAIN